MAGLDFGSLNLLELGENLKVYFRNVEKQTEAFEKLRVVVIERVDGLLQSDNPQGSVREIWQLLVSVCDTTNAQYYVVRHTSRFRDRFKTFLAN